MRRSGRYDDRLADSSGTLNPSDPKRRRTRENVVALLHGRMDVLGGAPTGAGPRALHHEQLSCPNLEDDLLAGAGILDHARGSDVKRCDEIRLDPPVPAALIPNA